MKQRDESKGTISSGRRFRVLTPHTHFLLPLQGHSGRPSTRTLTPRNEQDFGSLCSTSDESLDLGRAGSLGIGEIQILDRLLEAIKHGEFSFLFLPKLNSD